MAKPAGKSQPAFKSSPPGVDWKWFEDNYEPYKAPVIKKEDNHRPQVALPKLLVDPDRTPRRLAARSSRLVAAIVDNFLAGTIPFFLVMTSIPAGVKTADDVRALTPAQLSDVRVGLAVAGGMLLFIGIINLVLLAVRGQTIGKALIGIKIVGSDGYPCFGRIIFLRILLMNVLYLIPLVGLIDILMIFSEERQCLHDKIADTIVVRAR